jgi:hypothetical protein
MFSFQNLTKADDIRDFEIEGISLNDSALKHTNLENIKKMFKETKNHYNYLEEPLKFREVYILDSPKFQTYNTVSFMVNGNDSNYIIYFLRGMKNYVNNYDQCINQKNNIANEIEKLTTGFEKEINEGAHPLDKSGKSFSKQIIYKFNSGGKIVIGCNDWEEILRKKNDWTEGLSVAIMTDEVSNWLGYD